MPESKRKILIVEDEKSIADIISFNLKHEGFDTDIALDGNSALEKAGSESFDLILLDLMLPGIDGYEVCERIRKNSIIPIIVVSAKEEESDKVKALEMGADGYVTKPFGMRELVARVRATLRRCDYSAAADVPKDGILVFGDIELDTVRYEVKRKGTLIPLTIREFDLLCCLARGKGQIFSREELMETVWGYEYFGDIRTVDVTIRRLREKIEDDPSQPQYVITKRSLGYYFKSHSSN